MVEVIGDSGPEPNGLRRAADALHTAVIEADAGPVIVVGPSPIWMPRSSAGRSTASRSSRRRPESDRELLTGLLTPVDDGRDRIARPRMLALALSSGSVISGSGSRNVMLPAEYAPSSAGRSRG